MIFRHIAIRKKVLSKKYFSLSASKIVQSTFFTHILGDKSSFLGWHGSGNVYHFATNENGNFHPDG